MKLLESDPYWEEQFEKAAYNKFPKGISFKNEILTYTKGHQRKKMILPEDEFQAIENYKAFITSHTMNRSRSECRQDEIKNNDRVQNNKSLDEFEWKKIRRKKTKEALLLKFISDLSINYNLNEEERYDLHSIIHLNFALKIINTKTIDFSDGEIKSIINLEYDEEKRVFSVVELAKNKLNETNYDYSLDTKIYGKYRLSFETEWKKYIDAHVNKNESTYHTTHYESTTENS
jgi:hypothetical protein